MKKLLLFVLAAMAFAACTQNEVEELTANRADAPETLTVGFEGDDTRIELNEVCKTVWSAGDEASVFYRSNANQRWAFQGETGDRIGTLKRVANAEATAQMTNVVVYPYNTNYWLNYANGNIEATLPAVQSYKEGSYGADGNIMVAQSEFTQFSLKSVCGWLRVELTGEGEVVESVKVRGNNGEQVAGLIYVDTATAEATLASEMGEASDEEQVGGIGGGLEFDDTIFTEVTLDCGDGVELGAEATAFYIALLPQTFEKGMTIDINYANAEPQTLVCESSITIRRNHISPIGIEASEEEDVVNSQIFYTATALVEPYNTSAFNVAITSNKWDEATGEGVITFDGELTTIGEWAFSSCTDLTSVTIPDSVTSIGYRAFLGCDSLTSVTIPDSVKTIGEGAFSNCSNLAEFKGKFASEDGCCLIVDGVLNAFAVDCGATEYTIPDSVTTIGNFAFAYCTDLTSVTIPDSVTTIGFGAFGGCSSLTSVTIPDSVTTIGAYAFNGCSSLTSVTIPDSVTTIGITAFWDCSSLTSVYCEATTPPTLDYGAFYNNASGRKIYVPTESVETYKAAKNWSEYAADIVGYDFETGEVVDTTPANEL